ncbi:DedA family protein [Pseudonocardia sp. CA-107938]|uniref:DedA family protein n=1 Tax=Pseudonocardia sp. CA-107938 TaxID=3240021 RepID=UPI003D94272F
MDSWFASFFAMLDAIPTWQLFAVVGVLLVLETTALVGLVTPGEVVLLAAATTVGSGWEFAALAAVATVGTIVGQTGGYLIGRRTGPWLRESRAGRWIGEPNWQRAEDLVASGASRAIVGARFLAVAHSLVPVIAGSLRMDVGRFLRCTVVGAAAWALVYVGLGSAASAAIRHVAHLVGPTATGLVVAAVVGVLVVRAVRRRRAERVPAEVG